MEPAPASDEFYNDPLAINRGGGVGSNTTLGNTTTSINSVGPSVTGSLSTSNNLANNLNTTPTHSAAGDQRWPYGLPALTDHAKHQSTFEPECSTSFSGLPPLSQAFNAYPPSYSRLASGMGFMEAPYLPHAVTMTQRTAPITSSAPPFAYPSGATSDMHGYFGRSEELITGPPFIHPATAPTPPLPANSAATLNNTPLNSANSSGPASLSSAPGETRLPINGQPHRLSSTYSSSGMVHPSMDSPVPVQHFWPNFTLHNPAVSERAPNNNFRPSSPNVARPASETGPALGSSLSTTVTPNLSTTTGSGMTTAATVLPMPYKPPKVKQIYSFVPLPGAQTQKRPRRRYDEIERIYQCGWNGCEKAYGTLNHLNAHVFMQGHGEKRTPDEFKEIRALWRAKKKEEIKKKQAEDQIRQEEQKRHTLPSPQLSQQLSSMPESQQSHSSNLSHLVYAHLPQPLQNVYSYPPSQSTSMSESSHSHTYPTSTYHASLLPHLDQYTTHPQSYTNDNRDYKSHTDDEDRDAEGEPDPEASR